MSIVLNSFLLLLQRYIQNLFCTNIMADLAQRIQAFVKLGDFFRDYIHSKSEDSTTNPLAQWFEEFDEIIEQAEIRIKYQGYIDKERDLANKLGKLENLVIKDDLDYHQLTSLSFEAREKLSKIRPRTIGQAARMSGVSPADISVLAIYLGS